MTVQDTNKRFRTRLVHQKRGPQLRGFVEKKNFRRNAPLRYLRRFFLQKVGKSSYEAIQNNEAQNARQSEFFLSNGTTFDLLIV